jgi:hypothetical protein
MAWREAPPGVAVEAANVHVDVVRVRAGRVERVDAAALAEAVLGDARVELVHRERVGAREQGEALRRHDQVQDALLRAHRAVAVAGLELLDLDAEAHRAAMTAAFQGFHDARL